MSNKGFYEKYVDGLHLTEGDCVDIVSDTMSFFFYLRKKSITYDDNLLLDSIYEHVTASGTVMARAFTWDWCKGEPFDIRTSPSRVGKLGDVAMERDDFKRTQHPIYSWWVKGKHQNELCGMTNKTSFGEGSPFDFFEKQNGKMAILGNVNVIGLTGLHHIEKEIGIEYRYEKNFRSTYIDWDGNASEREYSMFVRKLNRQVLFNEENSRKRLVSTGVMREYLYDGFLKAAVISYRDLYDLLRDDFKRGLENEWVTIKPLEE